MFEFPMDKLTVTTGKNRKLLVKPDSALKRDGITLAGDTFTVNPATVKLKPGKYYIETKEQGHFHFYAKDADGQCSFYSKRETVDGDYRNLWEITNFRTAIQRILPFIPNETAIAVELIWPGHQDSQVPTAIKECPEELRVRALAVAINEGEMIMGTDTPYAKGRRILRNYFDKQDMVELHGMIVVDDKENTALQLEKLLAKAKKEGIEGFVLKRHHYLHWYKVKGIQECDAFVTGFKRSTSETYDGLVTSLLIGMYDGEEIKQVGRVSGLNDVLKFDITQSLNREGRGETNPYMNRVLRVTFQEVTVNGNIKHGFFDCWRDDKNAHECSVEQLR